MVEYAKWKLTNYPEAVQKKTTTASAAAEKKLSSAQALASKGKSGGGKVGGGSKGSNDPKGAKARMLHKIRLITAHMLVVLIMSMTIANNIGTRSPSTLSRSILMLLARQAKRWEPLKQCCKARKYSTNTRMS